MKKKYNKHGFTLLELSIVMGVLTILMTIVFKGKYIVQQSFYVKDIHRFSKIEIAFTAYTDLNKSKLKRTSWYYDYAPLMDSGWLDLDDIKSSIGNWTYLTTDVCLLDDGSVISESSNPLCRNISIPYPAQAIVPSVDTDGRFVIHDIQGELFCRFSNIINGEPTIPTESGIKTNSLELSYLTVSNFRNDCVNFPRTSNANGGYRAYILFKKYRII